MKLSFEEKETIEKISAIASKDVGTVKDVLRAVLIMTTLEVYANNFKVQIPYICTLKLNHYESETSRGSKIFVDIEAESSEALREEVRNVINGDLTPSQKFIQKQILYDIQNKLDIDKFNMEVVVED